MSAPKPAPATPAYVLQMQASMLVARMYGDDAYSVADDLGTDDALPGATPEEIAAWSEQADRAIERRHFVAAELARQRDHAKAEAARFRERAARLESEIERVKAPAVALMLAKRDLGEVDKEGKVKVKTACVSAWLIETESVDGPEDGALWPAEFQRTKIEPIKTTARESLIAYREVVERGVDLTSPDLTAKHADIELTALALGQAGVTLRPNTAIGWRS